MKLGQECFICRDATAFAPVIVIAQAGQNLPLDDPLRQSLIQQAEEMVALRRRQPS
jgi:hypothetical protein